MYEALKALKKLIDHHRKGGNKEVPVSCADLPMMHATIHAREFLNIQNQYCYIRCSRLLGANIVNQNSYQIYETSPLLMIDILYSMMDNSTMCPALVTRAAL